MGQEEERERDSGNVVDTQPVNYLYFSQGTIQLIVMNFSHSFLFYHDIFAARLHVIIILLLCVSDYLQPY